MALWKEYQRKEHVLMETDQAEGAMSASEPPRRVEERSKTSESFIGANLTIEGKIQGRSEPIVRPPRRFAPCTWRAPSIIRAAASRGSMSSSSRYTTTEVRPSPAT